MVVYVSRMMHLNLTKIILLKVESSIFFAMVVYLSPVATGYID